MEDANRTPCALYQATILSSLSGTLPARPTTRPRDPGTTFSELPVPSLQQRCTQRKFRANRRRLTSPFPDPSISSPPSPASLLPRHLCTPDRVYISFIYRSSRRFPLALAPELMSRGNGAGEFATDARVQPRYFQNGTLLCQLILRNDSLLVGGLLIDFFDRSKLRLFGKREGKGTFSLKFLILLIFGWWMLKIFLS